MTATTTAKRTATASRPDVYARVTESIVAHLEQGVRPWARPWNAEHAAARIALPRRHSGEPYRGINILLLWAETMTKGFAQQVWMTYRQAEALRAHVRRGERGSLVVYANRILRTEVDARGEEQETEIPFLKAYTVFNVEQIEGLPDTYYTGAPEVSTRLPLIDAAEAFFASTGATIRHAGHQAYYSPSADVVVLPPPESFIDAEAYAATKAHELTHWTRHPTRLDRDLGGTRFGDEGYAREELVAEVGAAFLCSELGVTADPREDHAAYLAHWLQILKADTRAIFQAAAHAQKAIDYLHSLQPASGDEPDPEPSASQDARPCTKTNTAPVREPGGAPQGTKADAVGGIGSMAQKMCGGLPARLSLRDARPNDRVHQGRAGLTQPPAAPEPA